MSKSPVFFATHVKFRAWLQKNAATATELQVGFWKVGSGHPSMTWPESVDEALCFGWIDGVRRGINEHSYRIRFTPRKPSSIWSAVNIAKFEQLQSEGRMTPAGEAAYARRKAERSVVYSYEQATVDELSTDEQRQFQHQKAAWSYFLSCPPGYQKTVRHWVFSAKKPETRSKRLVQLIEACAQGKRLQ